MTMRVLGGVVLGVWLGYLPAAAAQLPPEIQVDRYLLRAERLLEAKDPKGALELMGKIIALQKEHGLTLPGEFHFKHAKVALGAGSLQDALDAVNTYLLDAGREGKFYREALELLDDAEQDQEWIETRQTCAGQPKGTSCWMEVTGQVGCYVWNNSLAPDATVTWTGGCAGGRAQGEGTLRWVWDGGKETSESTGNLKDGKRHDGQWVFRDQDGNVQEGPYVDGKRHGQWVERLAGGGGAEGPWVDGKRHGQWVVRQANGIAGEGPFVDGKRQGQWVWRLADGGVHEGPYVDGKQHGQWVFREPDGAVEYATFESGERVGETSWRQSQARGAREDFTACVKVSNCAKEGSRVCIENDCSQPAFVRFCTAGVDGRYTLALCGAVSVRANDGFIHQGSVDHAAETFWKACPWDKAKGTKEQACYFELPP